VNLFSTLFEVDRGF